MHQIQLSDPLCSRSSSPPLSLAFFALLRSLLNLTRISCSCSGVCAQHSPPTRLLRSAPTRLFDYSARTVLRPGEASPRSNPTFCTCMEDTTCLVCGFPAELRCSSCYEGGKDGKGRPIVLRFCTEGHQKLVRSTCPKSALHMCTSKASSLALAQAWPVHKYFCGERAFPVRLPLFPQKDADRVIAIISNPSAVERFIPAHPKFGPMYLDYLEALGPSVEEVKVRPLVLFEPRARTADSH